MKLIGLLDSLLEGHQKVSVLVVARVRGDQVEGYMGEYVAYRKGDEVRTVHLGCFPPVTEDADAALKELGKQDDFFLGYDSDTGEYYLAIPGQRIFENAPSPALAISKALVRKAIRKEKQEPPILTTPEFEVDEEELLRSESRVN